jgi:hypothetical protein
MRQSARKQGAAEKKKEKKTMHVRALFGQD